MIMMSHEAEKLAERISEPERTRILELAADRAEEQGEEWIAEWCIRRICEEEGVALPD
jgi:hypothetical protein